MHRIEQRGSLAVRRGSLIPPLLVAVLCLAPGAAAQTAPPHSAPSGGRPPVEEVRKHARPFPIPTREPVERAEPPGSDERVPGIAIGFAAGMLVMIAALAHRWSRANRSSEPRPTRRPR
jgi:hypothetical protein